MTLGAHEKTADRGRFSKAVDDTDGARVLWVAAEPVERLLIGEIHDQHGVTVGGGVVYAEPHPLHSWQLRQELERFLESSINGFPAHIGLDPNDDLVPDHNPATTFRDDVTMERSPPE